jgi:hypothetical protein
LKRDRISIRAKKVPANSRAIGGGSLTKRIGIIAASKQHFRHYKVLEYRVKRTIPTKTIILFIELQNAKA